MFSYIRGLVSDYATKLHQKIRRFASKNPWYVLAAVALAFFLAGAALGSEGTIRPDFDKTFIAVDEQVGGCPDGRAYTQTLYIERPIELTEAGIAYKWDTESEPFLWMKYEVWDGQASLTWLVVRFGAEYKKYDNAEEVQSLYPRVCDFPSNAPEKKAAKDPPWFLAADADPGFLRPEGGYCDRCPKQA